MGGRPGNRPEALERLRKSRLHVQLVCTAVLVVAGWVADALPEGPWRRVSAGLEWVVTTDTDFAGQARRWNDWATAQGGWAEAAAGLWEQGVHLARAHLGLGAPTAPDGPAARDPAQTPLPPVEGKLLWGYGYLPAGVGEGFHYGIDLLAPVGTPVAAVLNGTVVAVRTDRDHGQLVEVRHGPVIAVYAQVEGVLVHAGDEVARGQALAAVARAQGVEESLPPHLHFALRPAAGSEPVDPVSFLGLGGTEP